MSLPRPHLVLRGSSLLCGLLLLAQWLPASPHPGRPSNGPVSGAQSGEPITLTPGRAVRREIGGSEAHKYNLELAESQYVSLLVSQQGSDVVVTVIDPEGARTTVDRPNGSRGREVASYIARRAGTHGLEIRSLERAAPRGGYEVVMAEPRPATTRDESRLAAERAVTEGETLRARKTAASLPQALEKFGQAIALWRALEEPYETAVALYGRCIAHRLLGGSEQAVGDCSESADLMRSLGDPYGEAVARTGRAWAYIYLGEPARAFADFSDSLSARRRIGDRQGATLDLLGVGWAYALQGDYDRALQHFHESLQELEDLGDPRGRPIRLAAVGEVYRRLGQPAQAIKHLTQALQLAREAGNDRAGEAETLSSIGWCQYALGQLGEAKESFSEALPIRRAVGDRAGEATTTLGLAHVERALGNLYNARLHIDDALGVVESLRARVASTPLRLSFFALVQDYYEFNVDLLMHMHRLDPDRGFAAAALEVIERARARGLLDLLNEARVDVRQEVPADLIDRERDLRARLNSAASYQRQLLSESHTAAQAAAAAKDVDDLTNAFANAEARIRQASPRLASLTRPQPVTAAYIQREIVDSETLLLEFALGRERSFLWVVSPAKVSAYELPPRRQIEDAAARVLELLTSRNRTVRGETGDQRRARVEAADGQYEAEAARLGGMLLAPAAGQLGTKRLLLVSAGVLQLVPFGALPLAPPGGGRPVPLVVNHEIVHLPSASTLAVLRRQPPSRQPPSKLISILADPVFSLADERFPETAARGKAAANAHLIPTTGAAAIKQGGVGGRGADAGEAERSYRELPRLFRTRWEAEQIADLAPPGAAVQSLDFMASRETATGAEVADSRIVHFATHAVLDDARPELSGIVLSMFGPDGRPRDGLLRMHDVFNLKLSADLVTLSACRTAAGREYGGEGLIGLTRGFMYAGARRVVGSVWSSDDKATAELMVRFYRKMLRENLQPAAALRAAQIEMQRDRRWQSPYFWAGFILQGEWR